MGTTDKRSSARKSSSRRNDGRDVPARKKSGRPSSGKKMSAREREKQKRKKIILVILEIFVLLLMVVVLYGVLKTEKVGKVDLDEEAIVINDEVMQKITGGDDAEGEPTMKGYRNIALFGVDSTSGALTKNTRSDSIMIASINMDTGECKLVSVYRDTYLNLGNDSYNKCNAAYAKGGPEQAINMLNMNLDLNITDFVTVGFAGLTDTIDALGGIEIDVDEAEIDHLNNYQKCIAEDLKRSYTPVTSTGYQNLNGLQATAYCRIRYTKGDDFKRAERQREVLQAVADKAKVKAKSGDVASLLKVVDAIFAEEEIYTSLGVEDFYEILSDVTKYNITATTGFPDENYRATGNIGSKGSCVVPVDLTQNVGLLHGFLFNDPSYSPSSAVQGYSDKIKSDTSSYIH